MADEPEIPAEETPPPDDKPADKPEAPDIKALVKEAVAEVLASQTSEEPEPEPDPNQPPDLMTQVRGMADRDPAARLALLTAQSVMLQAQLADIEDPKERKAVRDHIVKNPGAFKNVEQARDNLRAPALAQEVERLRAELEAERKRKKSEEEDIEPMGRGEPVSRKDGVKVFTAEQWNRRQAKLDGPARRAEQSKLGKEFLIEE